MSTGFTLRSFPKRNLNKINDAVNEMAKIISVKFEILGN
jgi:hypothetical protein